MPNNILIFDTTLRDGKQSPGASLDIHEKVQIAGTKAYLSAINRDTGAVSLRFVFAAILVIALFALVVSYREDHPAIQNLCNL